MALARRESNVENTEYDGFEVGEITTSVGDHTIVPDENSIDIDSSMIVDVDTSILKAAQYIDGGNWTVGYYGQVKSNDDSVNNVDINAVITSNNYYHIPKLDIKVTSPISAGNANDAEFTANLPIGVAPLIGDIIVAQAAGGELAMFRVSDMSQRSYNRQAIWTITAKLDSLVNTNPSVFDNLKSKVIREFVYDGTLNGPQIIKKEAYAERLTLDDHIYNLTDDYLDFTSQTNSLLMCDGVYDPLITALYFSIADFDGADKKMLSISQYNFVTEEFGNGTIIEAILNRKPISFLNKRNYYRLWAEDVENDNPYNNRSRPGSMYGIKYNIIPTPAPTLVEEDFDRHILLPQHKGTDNTYLVTSAFYGDDLSLLSEFEKALHNMVNDEIITNLLTLLSAYSEFSDMERYQYGPALLAMAIYSR